MEKLIHRGKKSRLKKATLVELLTGTRKKLHTFMPRTQFQPLKAQPWSDSYSLLCMKCLPSSSGLTRSSLQSISEGISPPCHTNISICRWRPRGSEWLSNLPKLSQQIDRAEIQTQIDCKALILRCNTMTITAAGIICLKLFTQTFSFFFTLKINTRGIRLSN